MLSLAIDTSSAVSASVVSDDRVTEHRTYAPRGHAELLADHVQRALDAAGVAGRDIERVIVGTGPAPFTGLRVGIVTARALARAWDVPLLGVCSLDALGAQAGEESADVTVVTDARRREVYWASYRDGVRQGEPAVAAAADVPLRGAVVGRGATLYPDAFPREPSLLDPAPGWLAVVADREIAAGGTEFPTEPLYLRRPDVHGVAGA